MITYIKGLLVEATPLRAVIEVNGFGYEVIIPATTAEKLPQPGSGVKLHTLAVYREDSQTLYGFASETDRAFFQLMIDNVTGVGPKMAINILSRVSVPLLEGAIRSGDIATLAQCQGIGKKMAERLIVELKAKVGTSTTIAPVARGTDPERPASAHHDAVAALVALGYKPADADAAVRRAAIALGGEASTQALIKRALG